MGSTGWVVGLDRLGGRPRAADEQDAVKRAVFETLVDQWNENVDDPAAKRRARGWLDDVITVEVDSGDRPTFTIWLDLGADWDADRGDHWVRAGLALGRHSLDRRLVKLGLRVRQRGDAEGFPSMKSEFFGRAPGGSRCACELCSIVFDNWSLYSVVGYAGHEGAPLHRWAVDSTWVYVPSLVDRGHGLWVCPDATGGACIYVTWDEGERYERADLPDLARGHLRVIATRDADAGSFLASCELGGIEGPAWFRSTDRGEQWQRLDAHAAPGGACQGLVARPGAPATVLAVMRPSADETSMLYRSDDGGRSWGAPERGPLLDHVAFGQGDVVYALARDVDAGLPRPAVTRDGGKTWRLLAPVPFEAKQILVGRAPGTFVVFGDLVDANTGQSLGDCRARTTDDGATFTLGGQTTRLGHGTALAHPSGRWFFVPADGEFLQFSDDDGATWAVACDQQPQSLAVDPTRERSIFLSEHDRLLRLWWA